MATSPVTPQRVKDILSSFLFRKENHKDNSLCEDLVNTSSTTGLNDTSITDAAPPELSDAPSISRSYNSFIKRVETFSPLQWFAKPVELSPMVCARYGWDNADFDMLYCKACKANLCGSLPSKSDSSTYRKACKTLVTKLLTAHEKFCPISVNPCPESYLRVDLDDHEGLHQDFLQRLNSLHQSQQYLPELDYGPLQIWGFHKHLAAKFIEEKMTESDILTQAVILSFTGWTVRQGSDQILTCTKCQRQIGLWNYKQNSSSSMNNITRQLPPSTIDGSGDCEPSSKLRKIEMQDQLDPIGSHHVWCPWTALRKLTDNSLNTSTSSIDESQSPPPPSPVSHSLSPTAGSLPSLALQRSHEADAVGSPPNNRPAAGDDEDQRLPAWVLSVHIITPGLLSQSHRLSQEIKQGTMVEGLRCIRKVLSMWSPPTIKTSQESSK